MTNIDESKETLELLQHAADGVDVAVDQLFEKHLPMVKTSIGKRIRPQARRRFDASDVIQETHQSARRQLADFLDRRPMPFRLWLLRNAHQRLADLERAHLRAARRSVDREVPLPDQSSMNLLGMLAGTGPSPLQQVSLAEQARSVRRCLAELSELDRDVLMFRVFDGLKNTEVAELLGISADAAKKRFARAIERLRVLLVEAGIKELDQ